VCNNIKVVTKSKGFEVSWRFGNCKSEQSYGDNEEYNEECCQHPANYELTCKDDCNDMQCLLGNGQGWQGGYIEIGGSKYCQNFERTKTQTVEHIK